MRVLLTADAVGGVWTFTEELVHALDGHEVHVVVLGPPPPGPVPGAASTTHLEVALEWMPDPWCDVDASGQRLLEIERELAPDVVHLGGYAHAALPFAAPVLLTAHSDVVSWLRAVHGTEPPPAWDAYRERVAAGLLAAAAVVAPTAAVAQDLHVSYGHGGATVVPNGRRDLFGEPGPKQRCVLASGRAWDEAKGLDALARVAPGATVLTGATPAELHARMREAAVYCAPSRYEPFGLGVLEAALAGCALVLGDLPSLREVWGAAATYADGDRALRESLDAALEDATAGARARERALQLTPERTARGYLDVYGGLAA